MTGKLSLKNFLYVFSFLLFILIAERYFFSTSEIRTEILPPILKASYSSELILSVKTVNRFGFENILDNSAYFFKIEQGENLVILEILNEKETKVISKGREGEAVIGIYSVVSGLFLRSIIITITSGGYADVLIVCDLLLK